MNSPLISVLIPVYNADKYISEAIESILNQSYKNTEIIIVDDASTDNTWKIIKKFVKRDKRIRVYRNKKNLYIAGNRNRLINLAKGKYIAWQDADDISMPKRLEHQYNFLEKNPSVGIVGGYLEFFNSGSKNTSIRKYSMNDKDLRAKIFCYSPVAQPTAMIRTKIFKEVGEYNLKYPLAEDIDMSFRIGLRYQFANLPEITLRYRENNQSATYKKLQKIELSTLDVRDIYSKLGYKMDLKDKVYNFFMLIGAYIPIIPASFKIQVFNFFRNSR